MRKLLITGMLGLLILAPVSMSYANIPNISTAINSFVETLYPKGSHYFWVINDTTTESQREMVVDINTTLQSETNEEATQHRFLLLIIDGELFGAHKIPLGANVDCKQESEV